MPPRPRVPAPDEDDTDSEIELNYGGRTPSSGDLVGASDEDEDEDDDQPDDNDEPQTPLPNLEPPPPYLRDISTLASWTVSSSKPGCSVPQLRHPSPALFWQSDGPQPHYLNIHFFKLVRIVGLRLYLDFEQDESYTPTRIIFLAGSGMNDLQEWGEMKLESPRGWIWADFGNVGEEEEEGDGEEDGEGDTRMLDLPPPPPLPTHVTNQPNPVPVDASSDSENNNPETQTQTPQLHPPNPNNPSFTTPTLPLPRPTPRLPFTSLPLSPTTRLPTSPRRPRMPVLRAHLLQIKILENHQNGKDTHLRGLQVFARNDERGMPVRGRDGGGRREREREEVEWELGGLEEGGVR